MKYCRITTFIILLIIMAGTAFAASGCANDTAFSEPETTIQPSTTEETEPRDKEAPVIIAPINIYTSVGSVVRYKSYITVTDNMDDDCTVTVDNSHVNLAVPGEYLVYFTATDSAGNVCEKSVGVIVNEQTETDYSDEVIYAKADEILDRIITDDMTDLEKVFAVFYHIRDNYRYAPDQKHWSYKQEAYDFMNKMYGSCYGNVSLSKLMLERLGYDSIMVEGSLGIDGEAHYWNLVSIDGGKNWYIYDSIWVMFDELPLCMITKDFAEALAYKYDREYKCDWSVYPNIAEDPLWTWKDYADANIPQP